MEEAEKKFFCLSNINIAVTYFTTHLSSLSTCVAKGKFKENILRATFTMLHAGETTILRGAQFMLLLSAPRQSEDSQKVKLTPSG
jgi:hypothetical protein